MKDLFKDFQKKFGEGSIMYLEGTSYSSHDLGYVSTGVFSIDYAIGQPGIPLGRIIEISGFESVGKSTLAASILGSFHRNDGVCVLFDSEHSYTPNWAVQFGVDPKKLILVQPGSLEQCMEEMIFITDVIRNEQTNRPVVLVLDSVAATPPQAEVDGEFTDQNIGLHARILSKGLRKLSDVIWDRKISLVFINQMKERPMGYGASKGCIGGRAIPFHAAVRIEVKKTQILDGGRGIRCKAIVLKNKLAAPFREVEFEIDFEKGFNDAPTIVSVATQMGLVKKKGGGWYELEGRDKSVQSGELAEAIKFDVYRKVFGDGYSPKGEEPTVEESGTPGEKNTKVFKIEVPGDDIDSNALSGIGLSQAQE